MPFGIPLGPRRPCPFPTSCRPGVSPESVPEPDPEPPFGPGADSELELRIREIEEWRRLRDWAVLASTW